MSTHSVGEVPDDDESQVVSVGRSRIEEFRRPLTDLAKHPAAALGCFLVAMMIAMTFANEHFLTRNNLVAMGLAVSVIGIAAVGQTFVIISAGIDLSTESVIALTSILVADLLRDGAPIGTVLVLALLLGCGCGLLNGLIISQLRVNPVIATLGTMTLFRGLARLYAEGRTIAVGNSTIRSIGVDELPGGIPIPVVIMFACFAIGSAVLVWTTFGRSTYLIGDNLEAARLAGIRTKLVQAGVYTVAGLFSAIAGIMFTAMVGAGLPNGASGTSLTVIAAVILGGTSLTGGIGRMGGTLIGVLVLGVIDDALILLHVRSDWQLVVVGAVLVAAVALDQGRLRISEIGLAKRTARRDR